MGQAISISELSIKVRLDSKSATAGLKRLEKQLKTFQHYVSKSLTIEKLKTKALHDQVNAKKRLWWFQKKSNKENKKALRLMRKTAKAASFMKNMMIGGMIGNLVGKLHSGIRKVTQTGMAVNMARMSLGAAVAGSSSAQGKSQAEVDAMSANQKAFAMQVAGKYGQNVAGGTAQYAKFFAAASNNIGVKDTMAMYESLSKLGVVYGLTGEKMERAMTAFTQMASKNQVMAEELKQQLGDVLPGSMEIFAAAMTKMEKYGIVTVDRLYDMMAKGEIVASEVFPAIAEHMGELAEANSALDKALLETSVQWNILKSNFEFFSTSALNQFNDTLGSLIGKITKLISGKGFATAIGHFIDVYLNAFTSRFDEFFQTMEDFEAKFAKATSDKERAKLIDDLFAIDGKIVTDFLTILKNLFTDVFSFFVDGFVAAINLISKDNLKALGDTLAMVFMYAWDAFYNNLGDGTVKTMIDWVAPSGPEKADYLTQRWEGHKKPTTDEYFEMSKKQNQANVNVVNNIEVVKDDVNIETLVNGETQGLESKKVTLGSGGSSGRASGGRR